MTKYRRKNGVDNPVTLNAFLIISLSFTTSSFHCVFELDTTTNFQVEHILSFLDEFAKNIVVQGVHMVYNAQGHPSGEAFIQMDSEASAFLCAQQKHHRYMTFGKKQRYIEVRTLT